MRSTSPFELSGPSFSFLQISSYVLLFHILAHSCANNPFVLIFIHKTPGGGVYPSATLSPKLERSLLLAPELRGIRYLGTGNSAELAGQACASFLTTWPEA